MKTQENKNSQSSIFFLTTDHFFHKKLTRYIRLDEEDSMIYFTSDM
jgi:hypothetical protein